MKPKVAIIGDGNVGGALRDGLAENGYEVKTSGKDPARVHAIASWAEVIVLAVPFGERENAVRAMGGGTRGKILVDVTNALTADYAFAVEPTRESGAEQIVHFADGARVVKAFNTTFAETMRTGRVGEEALTLFVAGDDEMAKATVREMGSAIGFDPVDAGPLQNARWLETLGFFNIQLGYGQKMGTDIGFRLVH